MYRNGRLITILAANTVQKVISTHDYKKKTNSLAQKCAEVEHTLRFVEYIIHLFHIVGTVALYC